MGPARQGYGILVEDSTFARRLAISCLLIAYLMQAVFIFRQIRDQLPTCGAVQGFLRSLSDRWLSWSPWTPPDAASRPYDRLKSAAIAKEECAARLRIFASMTTLWMHMLLFRMSGLVFFTDAGVVWAPFIIDFLACFSWFILAAGSVVFSRRLTPPAADAILLSNFVVFVVEVNFVTDPPAWSDYSMVQVVRLLFGLQMESLQLVLLANVGFTVHWYVHYEELTRDSEFVWSFVVDVIVTILAVVASTLLKKFRALEARRIVDALWANRQLTAAHAMLHATYDVVLDLDEELRYVSDEGGRMLASFLLRSPHASIFKEGGAFSAVLGKSESKRFEELFTPQVGDQPNVKSFNVSLQDGNGSALPVEILAVACESCTFRQGFLVGIREASEVQQLRARPNNPLHQHVPHDCLEKLSSASSSPASASWQSSEFWSPSAMAGTPKVTRAALADDSRAEHIVWRVPPLSGGRRSRRRSLRPPESYSRPPSTPSEGARTTDSPQSRSSSGSTMAALGSSQQQQQQQQQPTPEVEEQRLQGQHELDP